MPGDRDAPDTGADMDADSNSQMLRCVECSKVFAAHDNADELVPAGTVTGGRCPNCGGDEFERVVLDLAE